MNSETSITKLILRVFYLTFGTESIYGSSKSKASQLIYTSRCLLV